MSIKSKSPFKPTNQLLTTINEDLEALESIYQCGLAQERISNDVLSLGRIQLGKFTVSRKFENARADFDRYVPYVPLPMVLVERILILVQKCSTSRQISSAKLKRSSQSSKMKRE
jgi:hypothetical protein